MGYLLFIKLDQESMSGVPKAEGRKEARVPLDETIKTTPTWRLGVPRLHIHSLDETIETTPTL